MINKNKFDLLLKQIFQIENKIEELKVIGQFDKANEYDNRLADIRKKASYITPDNEKDSDNLDEISMEVLSNLILLATEVDYYLLKENNIIENASNWEIDPDALEKINKLWKTLDDKLKYWEGTDHNPIEEIEFDKQIGKITLDIILYQLESEGVIEFSKVYKYCKKEFLINSIKEVLFNGARNELYDNKRKNKLMDLAKTLVEENLYEYKLWQEVLLIKGIQSKNDQIEIICNFSDKNKKETEDISNNDNNLEIYDDESIIKRIKSFFSHFIEGYNQRKLDFYWETKRGSAFRAEISDDEIIYLNDKLNKKIIENVKILKIASNGVSKYNFEKNTTFENLEEIEFLDRDNCSAYRLSPDRTYKCIGISSFENCKNLKTVKLR